ncbi:RTRAF protein, partial [Polyodon spathula]|nr:RTRAF protein [Polyodon spathula]
MFRRKLAALDYHNPTGFNCKVEAAVPFSDPQRAVLRADFSSPVCPLTCLSDETEFRNFVVWLEDQKIRHYKIEERGNLRNIHSPEWPKHFEKYLQDVASPFTVLERQEAVDWLLSLAVRFEYGDNEQMVQNEHSGECFVNVAPSDLQLYPCTIVLHTVQCCRAHSTLTQAQRFCARYSSLFIPIALSADKYKNCQPRAAVDNTRTQSDPLIHLDINNPDFKAGVLALANLLQIQRHDDYLVMLKAIRILVQERLTQEAIAKAGMSKEGLPVALEKHLLGFDTGDATLNEAAAILRLLHIEELRDLQTRINEAIVAVQAIIADPKTDHRLGKVGR